VLADVRPRAAPGPAPASLASPFLPVHGSVTLTVTSLTARIGSATAALAVAVGVLTGCAATNPGLDGLRSDPLVTADVPGLTETQLFGQIEFTALGKHEPATLTRLFKTADRTVTAADLARVAGKADVDGWKLSPAPNHTWTATKTIDGAPADLVIRRNFSSADRVLVAVELTESR
jgi:hypothetical protein